MKCPILLRFVTILFIATLLLFNACEDDPASADDDMDEEPEIEFNAEIASEQLTDFLIDEGLLTEDEIAWKGMFMNSSSDAGNRYIEHLEDSEYDIFLRLFTDMHGHLIPTENWREENGIKCEDENGVNGQWKSYSNAFRSDVEEFLVNQDNFEDKENEVEIVVREMHAGKQTTRNTTYVGTGSGENWFIEAIEDVMEQYREHRSEDAPEELFLASEGPCGKETENGEPNENGNGDEDTEGDLVVHFDSEIQTTAITPDGEFFVHSAVEAELEMEYDEESDLYLGTSSIGYRDYESSFSELGCTYDFSEGTISAEIENPQGAENGDDINFYLTAPTNGDEAPWVSIDCNGQDGEDFFGDIEISFTSWFPTFVLLQEENIVEDREVFLFTGWEESDDANVAAVNIIENSIDLTDFSQTDDENISIPVEEETKIEIRSAEN